MPIVNTNIIKEWFRTLKKPTEDQFWAWLDSFRHKWEKVPLDDVEGLPSALQKKADLVDGVVPEEQLPFSVKTSEVIALGNVTVEGANANLAVHSSGANAVRVNGVIRERTFPNAFPFTPLSFGSVKVLRGYALNDPALFYMAEGEELDEYKEPEIPDTALEIFKITLTPAGAIIDILSQIGGFKPKESDAWKSVLLTNDAATFLQHTVEASTYELNVSGAVSAPKICGLITKQGKYMWGGKPLLLYNNSGLPVQLLPAESIPENPNAKYIPFATGTSYIIKPGEYVLIKEKADKLIVVRLGGSASFPEGAAPGDVLTEGTEGPEWSNRLTNAEDYIDILFDDIAEETANRIAADNLLQFQIDAEHAKNVTQDGQIADLNIHQIIINTTTSINTNTVGSVTGKGQHGRNVRIANGVNAINLTCELSSNADFVASYTKLGSAAITFVAGGGATLVQVDSTNVMSGAVGSTACLTRNGNVFYLQISNR